MDIYYVKGMYAPESQNDLLDGPEGLGYVKPF
jgi:hypothetical protein